MKTISKFLLLTMLLLLVGLGTISAAEDVNDTSQVVDVVVENDVTIDVIEDTTTQSSAQIDQSNIIAKDNEIQNNNKTVKGASKTITVNSANFEQFFTKEDGSYGTSDLIQAGDIINLKGTFDGVRFVVDKSITLTSLNNDSKLYNCTVLVQGQEASGSVISNLYINNSAASTNAIQVKNSSNLLIKNNFAYVRGTTCFAGAMDYMNYSRIEFNYFQEEPLSDTYAHTTLVLGWCYYNTIANNTVKAYANGIYFSIYGKGEVDFIGGPCSYNNITGNTVEGNELHGEWCYAIQVMGTNNKVTYNTVRYGYRGISFSTGAGNEASYNDVHAIKEGIYSVDSMPVYKNNVHVTGGATGIVIYGDGGNVTENIVSSENGPAITIEGNNVYIGRNNLTSTGGNGIYQKTQHYNFIIEKNRINSKNTGILLVQQSGTMKSNDAVITGNNVISDAEYAIDCSTFGEKNNVNLTVTTSNVLVSSRGSGLSKAYNPPNATTTNFDEADTNKTITITQTTYNQWFVDGVANENITQNATVYLSGSFNNVDFTFNKKVHVIGKSCVINHGTITLTGDASLSTIQDVTIKNSNKDDITRHGIEIIEVNNCKITNVNINNYANKESLGIFIIDAQGNEVSESTITTSGDYINNGIMLYASDLNVIQDNQINLNQSNEPIKYTTELQFNSRVGTIQEVLHNHGILLLYSSENLIDGNNIKVTSMFNSYTFPTNDIKNSVVGLDIYFNSHNNRVKNNVINVKSYGPYTYGMGVLGAHWGSPESDNAKGNEYVSNNVTVEGGYFATGFIAGLNSIDTLIENNNIIVKAVKDSKTGGDNALGITLEASKNSKITGNNIELTGAGIYSMELFQSSGNTITNNGFKAIGTNPYGIAGYDSSNNDITTNNFTLRKVNVGTSDSANHADSIPIGDDGIYFLSNSAKNVIKFNTIDTNASTTVRLDSTTRNNVVQENLLKNKTAFGDITVTNLHSSNNVSNNFLHFVNITVNPVTANLTDNITLTAIVNSTTTDLSNLTVTFKLGVNTIGTAKVVNGIAQLKYTVSNLLKPTTYQIDVSVSGTNFQNATASSKATFTSDQTGTYIVMPEVYGGLGTTVTIKTNVYKTKGYGSIVEGTFTYYLDGKKIATWNLATQKQPAKPTYTIPSDATLGSHIIKVEYSGSSTYLGGENETILHVQTNSEVKSSDYTTKLGNTIIIAATVNSGGKTVESGTVRILIGTKQVATAQIKNGLVSYEYTVPADFDPKEYTLNITYDGDDAHTPASCVNKITFAPFTPTFYYNTTTVKVDTLASLALVIDNGLSGNSNYEVTGGNVSIKLNGQTLTDSSGKAITGSPVGGKIAFTFTAPIQLVGTNNITFVFDGNNKFESGSQTFTNGLIIKTDQSDTLVPTIDAISTVKYSNNVTISGKFVDTNNIALQNKDVTVKINGVSNTVKTNANGVFTFTTKATTVGTNTVVVSYAGDSVYNPAQTSTTFTVTKKPTKITFDTIGNVVYGDNVNIKGKFTDEDGNALISTILTLKVGSTSVNVTTDGNGVFTYAYAASSTGNVAVSASYAGNNRYDTTSASMSFTVAKKPTKITINTIKNVVYKDNVTITGKFTDNSGNALKYTNLVLKINNVDYTVTTDANGAYTYNYDATTVGNVDVVVSYTGNANYNATSISTSFTVNKKPTVITFDKLTGVVYNDDVTISGKFTDEDGNALIYTALTLKVGSTTVNVTTNGNGIFTYAYKASTVTDVSVSASYAGNNRYDVSSASMSFTVNKKPTVITFDKLTGVVYNDDVTISGKFTDEDGNALVATPISFRITGVTSVNITTDSKGVFTYAYKADNAGTFTVTASYAGNARYAATSATMNLVVGKKPTVLTIDNPGKVIVNDNVTITGKFTDEDGNNLINSNVKLTINGVTYNLTTNNKGVYSYGYEATTAGTIPVTVSYAGNAKFAATNTTMNLVVSKKPSIITIDNPGNVLINDVVTITGKFTDENGNALIYSNVKLTINGVTYNLTTNNKGVYSYGYEATTAGTVSVGVSYPGNAKYDAASASMSFTVNKKPTKLTFDDPGRVIVNDNVTITGKFTDGEGNALIYSNVKLTINGVTYNLTTNNKGVFSYDYEATSLGTIPVSVSYAGNAKYAATNTSMNLVVSKKPCIITIDNPGKVIINDNVTITGKFTDENGNALIYSNVKLTINGVTYNLTTNNKGVYSYVYQATTAGTNNVSVLYPGNAKYTNASDNISFNVNKKSTKLTIDDIATTPLNSNVTITGKFTNDEGTALINSNVAVTINGVKYTVKTNNKGIYSYTYKTTILGTNNVTVSYPGNNKYDNTSVSTSFKVGKKSTKLTINTPTKVYYNDIITFTGKFTNDDGAALINSNVVLTINGAKHTIKTDSNGVYSYDYKANTTGTNNVTISYPGNTKYENTSTSIKFNVDKKTTKLTINTPTKVYYNDIITFTGKFTNGDGTALVNSNVVLTINGAKHTIKTDSNGVYSYDYKANTTGTNNVTISYAGNAKYANTSKTINFDVIKKGTSLTINKPGNVLLNTNVTFTGKFTNADGTALVNSKVVLTINGVKHTITTDQNGVYNYTYKATVDGTNNVTISYGGNNKYEATSTTITFNVVKKATYLTINNPGNVYIGDEIVFTGKFTNDDGAALVNSNVALTINGVKYTIKTDNKGIYTFNYTANETGTKEVTISYPGNSKYASTATTISFDVNKKVTKLTVSKISSVKVNKSVVITGKFTNDDGAALVNSNVAVTVNGEKFTTKTNNNGVYSYSYTPTKAGTYNVVVSYPGNNKYANTSVSTTFTATA